MLVKVSGASGPVLDWMVGLALWGGVSISTFGPLFGKGFKAPCIKGRSIRLKPSTDWVQGGPIIEKERLLLQPSGLSWECSMGGTNWFKGQTPLIAAMRCYVVSQLGEEVEVPGELV